MRDSLELTYLSFENALQCAIPNGVDFSGVDHGHGRQNEDEALYSSWDFSLYIGSVNHDE
jgi:hypothetical protein